MKKLFAVLSLVVFSVFILGCRPANTIEKVEGKTIIKIERGVASFDNPRLVFSAESASLDYSGRTLEIHGVISITGDQFFLESNDVWVVPKIEIRDSNLLIPFPEDANYSIFIGKQHHLLPKIVAEEKK